MMTVVCDQKQFPFLFAAFNLIQDYSAPGIWKIHDLPSDNATKYRGALGIVPIRNSSRFQEIITEQLKELVKSGCKRFLICLLDCVDLPSNIEQLLTDAKSAIADDDKLFEIALVDNMVEKLESFLRNTKDGY